MRQTRTYSESFKKQVVEEISCGKFASTNQAARSYGIPGSKTVYVWVRKYGHQDLLPKRIRIESMKERDELKESRKRIRALEAALADAHMDRYLEQAFLEIACEKLNTTPEELKKKSGLTLSDALGKRDPGKG